MGAIQHPLHSKKRSRARTITSSLSCHVAHRSSRRAVRVIIHPIRGSLPALTRIARRRGSDAGTPRWRQSRPGTQSHLTRASNHLPPEGVHPIKFRSSSHDLLQPARRGASKSNRVDALPPSPGTKEHFPSPPFSPSPSSHYPPRRLTLTHGE